MSPTRAILVVAALAALAVAGYILISIGLQGRAVLIASAAIACAVGLGVMAYRGSDEGRAMAVVVLISLTGSLYVGELYFARLVPGWAVRLLSGGPPAEGRPDRRTRIDVLRDLRDGGDGGAVPEYYPADVVQQMGSLALPSGAAVPLAGVSARTTFSCNESGYWPVYRADEYGFANPGGMWDGEVQVGAVGDSFGHGNCVRWDDMPLSLVRRAYPRTLNISYSGNGPLLELAGIKEYLARVRPKAVLWFYYEGNDLENLQVEMANPILARYLAGNGSQNLAGRRSDLDIAIEAEIMRRAANPRNETVLDFLFLRNMRMSLGLGLVNPELSQTHRDVDPAILAPVLAEARRVVEGWGGRIYFIYLPEFARFGTGAPSPPSPHRDAVLRTAQELGLSVIDAVPLFAGQPDPAALYAMRRTNHYTPQGYRLVADAIVERLARDGLPPVPSAAQPR